MLNGHLERSGQTRSLTIVTSEHAFSLRPLIDDEASRTKQDLLFDCVCMEFIAMICFRDEVKRVLFETSQLMQANIREAWRRVKESAATLSISPLSMTLGGPLLLQPSVICIPDCMTAARDQQPQASALLIWSSCNRIGCEKELEDMRVILRTQLNSEVCAYTGSHCWLQWFNPISDEKFVVGLP